MDKKNVRSASGFEIILHAYETEANKKIRTEEYGTALYTLARVCALAVLAKVIDPRSKVRRADGTYALRDRLSNGGFNPYLVREMCDLMRDFDQLARLANAVENAYTLTLDDSGYMEYVTNDDDPDNDSLVDAANKLIKCDLGDGLDLVHEAVAAIIEEEQAQRKRDPRKKIDFLRTYTVWRLKRKVWIKVEESKGGWETVETFPIREVFKTIRRAIMESRAVQCDPRNGYAYLEDLSVDDDGDGGEEVVYRRLKKYGGLSEAVTDINGKVIAHTVERGTVERYDAIVDDLKLTQREQKFIEYRMQGYGRKAIATAMGISEDNAHRCAKRIREKAEKIGFTPDMWREMVSGFTPEDGGKDPKRVQLNAKNTPKPAKDPEAAKPAEFIIVAGRNSRHIK